MKIGREEGEVEKMRKRKRKGNGVIVMTRGVMGFASPLLHVDIDTTLFSRDPPDCGTRVGTLAYMTSLYKCFFDFHNHLPGSSLQLNRQSVFCNARLETPRVPCFRFRFRFQFIEQNACFSSPSS